jgi:hypothetical protein
MGLGKTLVILALIAGSLESKPEAPTSNRRPTLIIAPLSSTCESRVFNPYLLMAAYSHVELEDADSAVSFGIAN